MKQPSFLKTPSGRRIAYHYTESKSDLPGIVFLGGFRSDMEGTKAVYLESCARRAGWGFLRFDYSGHGRSSGHFLDGCIGDWAEDAFSVISTLTSGPQILVGSSMGGWISILVARQLREKVVGMVGIAAAPDFTEDSMWEGFTEVQREMLTIAKRIEIPSDYSDEPYVITKHLIDEGRNQLVLRAPLRLPFPVRLVHGSEDKDVPLSVPLRLIDHAQGDDIRLTIVKGADHRFSSETDLELILETIVGITTDE